MGTDSLWICVPPRVLCPGDKRSQSGVWLSQCLPLSTEIGCVGATGVQAAFYMDHTKGLFILEMRATEIFTQIKMLHRNKIKKTRYQRLYIFIYAVNVCMYVCMCML